MGKEAEKKDPESIREFTTRVEVIEEPRGKFGKMASWVERTTARMSAPVDRWLDKRDRLKEERDRQANDQSDRGK